jgi:hypothetical protein
MLSRKQDDMTSAFPSDMGGLLIEPMNPFLFFRGRWAYIYFAWSTHAHFLVWLGHAALQFTRFPAVVSPLYLAFALRV